MAHTPDSRTIIEPTPLGMMESREKDEREARIRILHSLAQALRTRVENTSNYLPSPLVRAVSGITGLFSPVVSVGWSFTEPLVSTIDERVSYELYSFFHNTLELLDQAVEPTGSHNQPPSPDIPLSKTTFNQNQIEDLTSEIERLKAALQMSSTTATLSQANIKLVEECEEKNVVIEQLIQKVEELQYAIDLLKKQAADEVAKEKLAYIRLSDAFENFKESHKERISQLLGKIDLLKSSEQNHEMKLKEEEIASLRVRVEELTLELNKRDTESIVDGNGSKSNANRMQALEMELADTRLRLVQVEAEKDELEMKLIQFQNQVKSMQRQTRELPHLRSAPILTIPETKEISPETPRSQNSDNSNVSSKSKRSVLDFFRRGSKQEQSIQGSDSV